MFFFFKQKTAYEMRISDWSSDVCSSDLDDRRHPSACVDPLPASGVGGRNDPAGQRCDARLRAGYDPPAVMVQAECARRARRSGCEQAAERHRRTVTQGVRIVGRTRDRRDHKFRSQAGQPGSQTRQILCRDRQGHQGGPSLVAVDAAGSRRCRRRRYDRQGQERRLAARQAGRHRQSGNEENRETGVKAVAAIRGLPLPISTQSDDPTMTLPTLIITARFLIFAVTVVLFGGPSVGKAKSRRLSTVKRSEEHTSELQSLNRTSYSV